MIRSNLPLVIAKLEALKAGIPAAARAAVAPEYWSRKLREVAEKTLVAWAHAETVVDQREALMRLVAQVMGTFAVIPLPAGGARYELSSPSGSKVAVGLVELGRQTQSTWTRRQYPGGVERHIRNREELPGKAEADMQSAREAVIRWIAEEKLKDPDDLDLEKRRDPSAPEYNALEGHILRVLGLHPTQGGPYTTAMQAGAESLMGAIGPWVAENFSSAATGNEFQGVARQWLGMVRVAWQDVVRAAYPIRVRLELRKALMKAKGSML